MQTILASLHMLGSKLTIKFSFFYNKKIEIKYNVQFAKVFNIIFTNLQE